MAQKLPKIIKPYNFARQNLEFTGEYDLFDLPRVKNLITKNSKLSVSLNFNLNDNIILAKGNLCFIVYLSCVNCLEPTEFKINCDLNLVFASADSNTPDDYDLVEIVDNYTEIDTIDFISEEVLLKLPEFPKHNHECIELNIEKQNLKQQKNIFAELKNFIK